MNVDRFFSFTGVLYMSISYGLGTSFVDVDIRHQHSDVNRSRQL